MPQSVAIRQRKTVGDWIVRPPRGDADTYPTRREAVAAGQQIAQQHGCVLEIETHAGGAIRRPP